MSGNKGGSGKGAFSLGWKSRPKTAAELAKKATLLAKEAEETDVTAKETKYKEAQLLVTNLEEEGKTIRSKIGGLEQQIKDLLKEEEQNYKDLQNAKRSLHEAKAVVDAIIKTGKTGVVDVEPQQSQRHNNNPKNVPTVVRDDSGTNNDKGSSKSLSSTEPSSGMTSPPPPRPSSPTTDATTHTRPAQPLPGQQPAGEPPPVPKREPIINAAPAPLPRPLVEKNAGKPIINQKINPSKNSPPPVPARPAKKEEKEGDKNATRPHSGSGTDLL